MATDVHQSIDDVMKDGIIKAVPLAEAVGFASFIAGYRAAGLEWPLDAD